MKTFGSEVTFKDYNKSLNRGSKVYVWTSKSVFVGMTQDRFVGNFKVHNTSRGGSRTDLSTLESNVKELPCEITIHMNINRKGCNVSAKAILLDWGMIDEKNIGLVLGGLSDK